MYPPSTGMNIKVVPHPESSSRLSPSPSVHISKPKPNPNPVPIPIPIPDRDQNQDQQDQQQSPNPATTKTKTTKHTKIHGFTLPPGTELALNVLHLLRDPKTFGPDADVFRPERWLEAAAAAAMDAKDGGGGGGGMRFKEMNSVVELAFGYGRFLCLGKGIALMEAGKVVFEVSFFLFLFLG